MEGEREKLLSYENTAHLQTIPAKLKEDDRKTRRIMVLIPIILIVLGITIVVLEATVLKAPGLVVVGGGFIGIGLLGLLIAKVAVTLEAKRIQLVESFINGVFILRWKLPEEEWLMYVEEMWGKNGRARTALWKANATFATVITVIGVVLMLILGVYVNGDDALGESLHMPGPIARCLVVFIVCVCILIIGTIGMWRLLSRMYRRAKAHGPYEQVIALGGLLYKDEVKPWGSTEEENRNWPLESSVDRLNCCQIIDSSCEIPYLDISLQRGNVTSKPHHLSVPFDRDQRPQMEQVVETLNKISYYKSPQPCEDVTLVAHERISS